MIPAHQQARVVAFYPVDQAMLLVDAAGPAAGKLEAQGLGLACFLAI